MREAFQLSSRVCCPLYLRGFRGGWRRIERALHVALPFLPAASQGYEWKSPPLSWLALFYHSTPPPSPNLHLLELRPRRRRLLTAPRSFLCSLFLPSGFRHSFRVRNTPSADSSLFFFLALFSTLDHVHDVSTFDHYHCFFALVQHPDFFKGLLRNQRLPYPATRSITFIRNTPCRHATFRGQALPTTNLQGPFLHIWLSTTTNGYLVFYTG